MPKSDFKIALPKTKGTHRVGSYVRDKFAAACIRIVEQQDRRDDVTYALAQEGVTFTGIEAESQDCAEALMDGVVGASVIGLNRLVDMACRDEYADDAGDICFATLDIAETDCELVIAFSKDGPQTIEDGQVVLASHPDSTRAYFNALGKSPTIRSKRGGLETAGRELYNNCPIVDITQSGKSLELNDYVPAGDPILKSTAVIAWRRSASNAPALQNLLKSLGASSAVQTLDQLPLLAQTQKPHALRAA